MPELTLPYIRPTSLSDPFREFTEDMLAKIIKTPDKKMTWFHYRQIFGPYSPAGTYDEAAYFLPWAFEYIRSHDEDAMDVITPLAWFISEYRPKLEADGTFEVCRDLMANYLDQCTSEFTVVHFDRTGCQAKGWSLNYLDYVNYSETVVAATCALISLTANADLAIRLYQRVAREDATPVEAAWFLEFARAHFSTEFGKPSKQCEIRKIIENMAIAERSAHLVATGLEDFADFPSYWRDTFNILGIESIPAPKGAEK